MILWHFFVWCPPEDWWKSLIFVVALFLSEFSYLPSRKLIKASQRMQRTMPLPNIVDQANLKQWKLSSMKHALAQHFESCKEIWTIQTSFVKSIDLPSYPNFDDRFTEFKDSGSIPHKFASGISSLCFLQSNTKKVKVSHMSTRTYLQFPILIWNSLLENIHGTCLAWGMWVKWISVFGCHCSSVPWTQRSFWDKGLPWKTITRF